MHLCKNHIPLINNTNQTPGCLTCKQTWQKKWYFKHNGRCWGHRCCSYSILCIVQIWKWATFLPKKRKYYYASSFVRNIRHLSSYLYMHLLELMRSVASMHIQKSHLRESKKKWGSQTTHYKFWNVWHTIWRR